MKAKRGAIAVKRICLKCNKPFPSFSPVNRLCTKCQEANESIHPRAAGVNIHREENGYGNERTH